VLHDDGDLLLTHHLARLCCSFSLFGPPTFAHLHNSLPATLEALQIAADFGFNFPLSELEEKWQTKGIRSSGADQNSGRSKFRYAV